jgi:hypothetical protein
MMKGESVTFEQVVEYVKSHSSKPFKTSKDCEFAAKVVFNRIQELKEIENRMGKPAKEIISYVESKRAMSRPIHFPINSIHILTLVSPNQTSGFNGLCQLPNRIDVLTGTRAVYPGYVCENELVLERVVGEPITATDRMNPGDIGPQFHLKKLRLK